MFPFKLNRSAHPSEIRTHRGNAIALAIIIFHGLWIASLPGIAQVAIVSAGSPAFPVYRQDQILIKPRPGVSLETLARFHLARAGTVRATFPAFGRLQVVSVPVGETVTGLIRQYQASGLVEYAEPDYVRQLALTAPNDPSYLDGTLWALNNYGQNGGTPHADISALAGWDYGVSASNIVVALLDTGVRYTHEDLAANMWSRPGDGSHGLNAIDGNNDPNDLHGHGSLMAGVLGGVGNNGKGVVGVAWQVQIMACKCFDTNGSASDSAILACVDYARTNGARIINASFDSPSFSLSLSNAVYATRQAGMIFVASSGNNTLNIDATPHYPSCYGLDNIVSVAYTTRNDVLGMFSNYGATNVDLAAPGDQIYSTFYGSDSSYYPPFSFYNVAGTSFAAAYVSGSAALMLAKYPGRTAQEIIRLLLNSTDPVAGLTGKCLTGGRLNLRKALERPLLTAVPIPPSAAFHFQVSCGTNRTCIIQASADSLAWVPIFTNTTTAASSGFDFTENSAVILSPYRFFRAALSP
jgi:subtilisin family serine protease